MTRDEIMALPAGRELDALVAEKVMGYEVRDRCVIIEGRRSGIPSYSKSISAAWEVVEALIKKEIYLDISVGSDKKWSVDINVPKSGTTYLVYAGEAHGDTAPEAIAKAALLVILEGRGIE